MWSSGLLVLPLLGLTAGTGPRVKTAKGWMEGTYKLTDPGAQKFASYEGIPYAVPPIERLRFQPPMKDDNFYKPHEALQATKPAADCPQLDPMGGEYKGSEDCLYLNVFTPQLESMSGSEQYPVMVWIHGGTFQFGSGSSEQYGAERLLDKKVIVVTLNYRLGALGFLTTGDLEAPPNVGLMDQVLALRWVKEHVSAFGGDPERVTLFGGGISVTAHLASPYSRGLFQQAIAMSGVWGEVPLLHKSKAPATYATKLAEGLGCDISEGSETSIVACLRTKSPKDILTQAATFRTFSAWPEPFTPTVDGYMENPMLPQPLHKVWDGQVSEFSLVPLMIGGTQHEGIMALVDFLQDETRLDKFNENFATEGPALLLGVDPEADPWQRDEGETATAEVLRSNYLGEETQFTPSNQEALVQLLSDVHVLGPVDRTVRQLAATKAPLYYYSYQHQGSFSVPMALGIWETLGVSHMDELFLLFRFAQVSDSWLGDLALKTEDDIEVSKKLVSIWTNFAKTGRPTEDDSWLPVTEERVEYAVLDAKPLRMEYSEERGKKWQELGRMLDLARKARATSKEEHPALEALRREREALVKKGMADDKDTREALHKENEALVNKQMEEDRAEKDPVIEEIIDTSIEDEIEPDKGETLGEDVKEDNEKAFDPTNLLFDPIAEMKKLLEMEVSEGKTFRDGLKALNVNLGELGLDDPWEHDEL